MPAGVGVVSWLGDGLAVVMGAPPCYRSWRKGARMPEQAESDAHTGGHGTRAVIAALLANLGIAVAKFVGFALTGASSMLAEAFHSGG